MHQDPVNDGTACTQIPNPHPGGHWALPGKGPCAGKNPTKAFWKECLPPFSWIKVRTLSRLWRKADAGTGCTSALCGLLSLFYHCLWGLLSVLWVRGSAAHPQCPELPVSPLPTRCHFLDLWAICSAQPPLPQLITLLSGWITALCLLCLSLKYLWFHILSEEIYKRRAFLRVQMMMEKECVAANSCRSLYWIPQDKLESINIGGSEQYRGNRELIGAA